jgi:DNA-binding NarL/FixJ family response regulator
MRWGSSINAQSSKSGEEQQGQQESSYERREYSQQKRQYDRRESTALRGQVRNDRRQKNWGDLTVLRNRPTHLHDEVLNARFISPRLYGEHSALLRLCVITGQADLSSQLQSSSDRFSSIQINQHNFEETEHFDNKFEELNPDVILIDMRLSVDSVIKQLRMIRRKMTSVKIILLYDLVFPEFINEIVENRITGILQNGTDYNLFEKAVHAVNRGEFWFPHHLMRQIFDTFSKRQNLPDPFLSRDIFFTNCEREIVKLVIKGLSNKQIAHQLIVSPETVKKHLRAIFLKTGVKSRCQLISEFLGN